MAKPPPVTCAVIFSTRESVVSAVRGELKKYGLTFEAVVASEKPVEINDALAAAESPLLVIDWDVGLHKALLVLKSIQGRHPAGTIPTYLIVSEVAGDIVAAAREYGVMKLSAGEVTGQVVKSALNDLFTEIARITPIRELMARIQQARQAKDLEGAIQAIREAEEKLKINPRIQMELADCYMHLGKWREARSILEPLQKTEPPPVRAMQMLGRCLLKLGEMDEGLGTLNRAQASSPLNPERLVEIGNALLKIGEIDKAEVRFDEALALDPDDPDAQKGKTKVMLLEGEVNDALKILNQISSPREIAAIFNSSAVISIRKGAIDQGLKLYDAALMALAGDDHIAARLHYNKGIGFMHAGRPQDARQSFLAATQLDPSYEDARHNVDVLEGRKKSSKPAAAPGPSEPAEEPASPSPSPSPADTSQQAPGDPLGFGNPVVDFDDDDDDLDEEEQL